MLFTQKLISEATNNNKQPGHSLLGINDTCILYRHN